MRTLILLVTASILAGCVTQQSPTQPPAVAPTPAAAVSTSSQGGLAFDPPGTAHAATPDLSRDARQPTASNGIEPATTTYNVSTSIQDTTTDGAYNQSSTTERTGTVQH